MNATLFVKKKEINRQNSVSCIWTKHKQFSKTRGIVWRCQKLFRFETIYSVCVGCTVHSTCFFQRGRRVCHRLRRDQARRGVFNTNGSGQRWPTLMWNHGCVSKAQALVGIKRGVSRVVCRCRPNLTLAVAGRGLLALHFNRK